MGRYDAAVMGKHVVVCGNPSVSQVTLMDAAVLVSIVFQLCIPSQHMFVLVSSAAYFHVKINMVFALLLS